MAKDTATVHSQEDTHFEDLNQVVMTDFISTAGVTANDIKSNIDGLFSKLFESASTRTVEQAGFEALDDVRSTRMFMQRDADKPTMTVYSVQLIDRILHSASIYGLGTHLRRALAVQELVFNLNLGFNLDGSTPLNLKSFGLRLVSLLQQLDSNMQARGISWPRLYDVQRGTSGHPFSDDGVADSMSRYVNLCAFAKYLAREDIDVFGWEDIMKTCFDLARNNMPSRIPSRDNGGGLDTWKAYLSGAEAWVDQYVIQKSLQGGHVSQEAWLMWQYMFTEASSAMPNPDFKTPRDSFIQASREIQRVLGGVSDDTEARHTRQSHMQRTPKGRPLRISANVWPATVYKR